MDLEKIEKLNELLKDFLGSKRIIISHAITRLTVIGENYGSTMLALKINTENGNKQEVIEAVAKVPPPGEFIQRMFNIPITFRNEIYFYKTIIPQLKQFLHGQGVDNFLDCFPEFYGARLSLNDNKTIADDGAVLLLENLKVLDYVVVERTVGFDLKTSKLILSDLAKFHSAPLAMKLLRPNDFQRIKASFTPFKVFDMDQNMERAVIEKIRKIVEDIEDCRQYSERVQNAMDASRVFTEPKNSVPGREPFATIIHTDAWVNNFMVQLVDGEPVSSKIVDFQLCEYGSLARDVIFFIFTSVQIPVIEQHYEALIEFYYSTFVGYLEKMGCKTAPFSLQEFHEEIRLVIAECEFFHCMIMLEPIYATQDSLKELDEYKEEDMTIQRETPKKHKERASFIIKQFVNRKFI